MKMFNRTISVSLLFGLLSVISLAQAVPSSPGPSEILNRPAARANNADGTQRPTAGFFFKTYPAVIALALYSISAIVQWIHFFRIGRRFMLTLTIGMTCMATGMLLRIVYAHNPYSLGVYIIMYMFVLLSPCAFLATDYILLSRLANSLGREIADDCLFLPSRVITKIFVWSDVITFLIQSSGGGLTASQNPSSSSLGEKIALVGLALQLASFGLFTMLLVIFGFKVRSKYPEAWSMDSRGQTVLSAIGPFKTAPIHRWKILFYTMCLTCIAILIRSAFRIAEYVGGYTGYLSVHEAYFYCLDALPLYIAMTLYCFLWPTRFIDSEERPSSESKEMAYLRSTGSGRSSS